MHLLLGCSIARDARLGAAGADVVLSRARGGNCWRKLAERLSQDLDVWRREATSQVREPMLSITPTWARPPFVIVG